MSLQDEILSRLSLDFPRKFGCFRHVIRRLLQPAFLSMQAGHDNLEIRQRESRQVWQNHGYLLESELGVGKQSARTLLRNHSFLMTRVSGNLHEHLGYLDWCHEHKSYRT